MAAGTTYKQRGCRDGNGRRLGKKCPRLRRSNGAWSRDHGSWYYQLELPAHPDGSRRTPLRRGGFASRAAAQQELNQARQLLAIPLPGDQDGRRRIADLLGRSVRTGGGLPDVATVRRLARAGRELAVPQLTGELLEEWLAAAKNLRPGTVRSYSAHIHLYYKPHIGHIRIDQLRVADVASVFDAIDEVSDAITEARARGDTAFLASFRGRRVVGAATRQRIRATLRSAITTYMKQNPGVLEINPAALVDLPPGRRPRPLVWTAERIRAWQAEFDARLGQARARGGRVDPVAVYVSVPRPSAVMVWTPTQTAAFLRQARRHRLYALYHLIAFRGLRRGEAGGLRRTDTDLRTAVATVRWQIVQLGWETSQGAPKSDAGERHVALDTRYTSTVVRRARVQATYSLRWVSS
jgi:integrase